MVLVPQAVWEQILRDLAEIKRLEAARSAVPAPAVPAPVVPASTVRPAVGVAAPPTRSTTNLAPEAGADREAAAKEAAAEQDPQKPEELDTVVGYVFDFKSGGKNSSYYRLNLPGGPLSHGKIPVLAKPNESIRELVRASKSDDNDGDSPAYILKLDRGTASDKGDLFKLLGVKEQPFKVGGLLGSLRGVTQVTGQTNLDQINASIGLETPPVHPVSLVNKSGFITNWLTFGVVADKAIRSTGGGANDSSGLATYRSFIGRGFNWTRSGDPEKAKDQRQQVVNALLEMAPHWSDVEAKWSEIDAKAFNDRTYLERRFWDLGAFQLQVGNVGATATEAAALGLPPGLAFAKNISAPFPSASTPDQSAANDAYLKTEVEKYVTTLTTVPDQPTTAVWLEAGGWYRFSGDSIGGKRFNNLLAASFKQQLNLLSRGDTLTLRYELGRERADPTERRNFLAVSYGKTW